MSDYLQDNGHAMDLLAASLTTEGSRHERVRRVLQEVLSRLEDVDALGITCHRWIPSEPRFHLDYYCGASREADQEAICQTLVSEGLHDAYVSGRRGLGESIPQSAHQPFNALLFDLLTEREIDARRVQDLYFRPVGMEDWRCFGRQSPNNELVVLCAAVTAEKGDQSESSQHLLRLAERVIESTATLAAWPTEPAPAGPELSKAQRPVYELALQGLTEKQIALRLHRSHHTVHSHLKVVYAKHHVSSRAELLALHLDRRE